MQRAFDRFGRLRSIAYLNESPKRTPDVRFSYDIRGSRTGMAEFTGANFTTRVRETRFTYDKAGRMLSAAFDNDGNGTTYRRCAMRFCATSAVPCFA